MGNGGGIIAGAVAFVIGVVFLFVGSSILNISPESKATDQFMQTLENTPRSFGWAFVIGGILGLIIGFILIIASARTQG